MDDPNQMAKEIEQRRLQGQNEVLLHALGQAILAPIDLKKGSLYILDSGGAGGCWSRSLAKACAPVQHHFFSADIDGTIFPSNPESGFTYIAHDIRKPWPAEYQGFFDLVHQRNVLAGA